MKRLIAAVFAVLSLLAAPAFADELKMDQVWAEDHNFVAPAQ
jgi:hypothetical protein